MNHVRPTILVCDDESSIREAFTLILQDDYRVVTVATGEAALKKVSDDKVDLVFLDIRMPGMDGIEALKKIKEMDQAIPVVMVTAVNDVQKASLATSLGSYHYIVKPFNIEEMLAITRTILGKKSLIDEIRPIREQKLGEQDIPQLLGQTRRVNEIREMLPELGKSEVPICLMGETGTEKRVIAELLHQKSTDRSGPFHSFLCGAFSAKAMRTKLFGAERGSFTANLGREVGMIEQSDRGTLFIDHIEKMSVSLQQELARVVMERRVVREGSEVPIHLDVTFIFGAAPSVAQALEHRFSEVAMQTVIEIPPLRERLEDLPLLAQSFLERANRQLGRSVKITDETIYPILESYDWPGNVEELARVIERIVFLSGQGNASLIEGIPISILSKLDLARFPSDADRFSLEALTNRLERNYLRRVLEKVYANEEEAARLLGINVNTLRLKCELLGISTSA